MRRIILMMHPDNRAGGYQGGYIMSIGLTELKTEYMTKPLGMDCACPRFSWKLVAMRMSGMWFRTHIV